MEKEYFAFISYKEDDYKYAKWLQKELEKYRLPTSIRRENPDLPERIRPVFEYKSEMAGGELKPEIDKALAGSQYLIVICSPNATKSPWVADEVQRFIDTGRTDKIIPFVVAGEAYSKDPAKECFPVPLRKLAEPKRGISINEMGRDAAVIKVIAEMLGVKFDSLWRRYEREQRRKNWLWSAFFFALAAIASGVAYWMSEKNTELELAYNNLDSAYGQIREDSIVQAKHIMRIQGDSVRIALQNDSISITNERLAKTNSQLQRTNDQLNQSRDSITRQNKELIATNLELKKTNLRFLMKQADIMMENGDAVHARMIAYDALVNKDNPYIPEMESLFRRSMTRNGMIIKTGTQSTLGSTFFSVDGKYIFMKSYDSMQSSVGPLRIYNTSTGRPVSEAFPQCNDWSISRNTKEMLLICNNQLVRLDNNMNILENKDIGDRNLELINCKYAISWIGEHERNDVLELVDLKDFSHVATLHNIKWWYGFIMSDSQKYIAGRIGKNNDSIGVWNAKTGDVLSSFRACDKPLGASMRVGITGISFRNNDSLLYTSSVDKKIRLWNIHTKECLKEITAPSPIYDMQLAENGKLIYYGCENGKVYEYNLKLDSITFEKEVHSMSPSLFVDYHEGKLLSAGNDGTIRIIGGSYYSHPQKNISGHTNFVNRAVYSQSSGNILTCGNDSLLILHKPSKSRYSNIYLKGYDGHIMAMDISNDGKHIVAISSDSIVREWDIDNQKNPSVLTKLDIDWRSIDNVLYSPTDRCIAISVANKVKLWDLNKCCIIGELDGSSPCYSIDGNFLYMHTDKGIMCYNISQQTNKIICDRIKNGQKLKLSDDGRYLATINEDFTISIIDLFSSSIVANIINNYGLVTSLSFSPSGRYLVSAGIVDNVKIWDVQTGILIEQIPNLPEIPTALFVAEDSILVAGGTDIIPGSKSFCKIIKFSSLKDLLEIGRDKFFLAPLTEEERKRLYYSE